jgi:hypothetical protein
MPEIIRQKDSSVLPLSQSYVDNRITTVDASIVNINNYQLIQDASIFALTAYNVEASTRSIYIDACIGNDTTGDGSIAGLPYATLEKALSTVRKNIYSGVTVTIYMSDGSFGVSKNALDYLQNFEGPGDLEIIGHLNLDSSGFTLGAADASDPVKYSVSGGTTSTWTTDLHKHKLFKITSGETYYPITHNSSTYLSLANNGLSGNGTEIYSRGTTLNFNINSFQSIRFQTNIKLQRVVFVNPNGFVLYSWPGLIQFREVYFNYSSIKSHFLSNPFEFVTNWQMYYCSFNNFRLIIDTRGRLFRFNYMYQNANSTNISLQATNGQEFTNIVLENPNTGSTAGNISIVSPAGLWGYKFGGFLKSINSNVLLLTSSYSNIDFIDVSSFIFSNTNYFFRRGSVSSTFDYEPTSFSFKTNQIVNRPTIRWFYDPLYELVNLTSGRNIQITGVLYPEFETNKQSKLVTSTTTDISIGHTSQNKSISVDYTLSRSNAYAEGKFNILIDQSANLYTSVDRYISSGNTIVHDPAIQFDAILDGSIIKWRNTLDATGGDASINYNISRVMRTPLTI